MRERCGGSLNSVIKRGRSFDLVGGEDGGRKECKETLNRNNRKTLRKQKKKCFYRKLVIKKLLRTVPPWCISKVNQQTTRKTNRNSELVQDVLQGLMLFLV